MNKSRNQLERLSNVEIGQLLVQYGFPNIPVTATTRKVLLSRLRTRIQQDQEKLRKDTSYVTRYSSGEESDKDTRQMDLPSPQRPHKSTPYATMPPPAAKKRHTTYPTVKVPIQPRNSVFVPPPIVADTDEDSDIHLPPDYKHNSYASSRLSGFTFRKRYTPQADDGPYLDAGASPRFAGTNTSSSSNGHNSAEESPYLSDFTKRLLRLRGETVSKEAATSRSTSNRYFSGHQVPEINSSSSSTIDSIVHHAPETPTLPRVPPQQPPQSVQTALSNLLSRLDEQYSFKQTLVPCLLVTTFIVFITFVLFAYLTISPDLVNTLSAEVAVVDFCEVDNPALRRPGYSCIERDEVNGALDMLKSIAPELQARVEVARCRDPGRSFTMTATEVIQLVARANPTVTVMRIVQQLHNMEYLIERNPQWRVNHVNAEGEALTLDEVVQLRESRGNCFGILNPRLPLSCLFWSKMQTFFLIVGTISLLAISVYGGNLFWRFVVHVKRSRQAKVDRMISEIISVLMEQTSNDSGGLVLVNHVRDKIIPPAQRRQMEAAWTEAIEHLEKNESRIQFEMGNRNGEDCRMMRWIDTVAPSMLHHRNTAGGSAVKKWLSPAFGKSNKIKDPPTACLKIRQMFEKYETNNPNLKTIITDAILEKVGPKCRIFDVQLEKTACCVYVRCATPKDAGIVHDEINGWWFDNHLVSIKFLRLERYTSRFPKSNAGPAPLRPSNTKNLSMSQCFTEPPENAFADDDDED